MTDFNLVPVTLRTARAFVTAHHRHNVAPQGHKFSVGIERDGNIAGSLHTPFRRNPAPAFGPLAFGRLE